MSKPPVPYASTLAVRDSCLCLHAQRAARALARRFDKVFTPVRLTNGQFSLLMALNRPSPPNLRAVADLLAMDRTTLTAALKPLQRRGLVSSAIDPKDRRNRLLSLTDAGGGLLAEALPIWLREHADIEAGMGADANTLRAALIEMTRQDDPAGSSVGPGHRRRGG